MTEISPYIDEDSTDQEVLARDATETELDSRQSATELPHSRDSEDSTDQDATEAEALQIEQDSQASTYVLVEDTTDQDVDTRDATEAYPYEIIEAREVIHHADENKLDSESATEASEDSESRVASEDESATEASEDSESRVASEDESATEASEDSESRVASEDESATEASEEVETRNATEVSPYVLIEDNADQDVEISDATEANDQDSREASVTEVYEADSS